MAATRSRKEERVYKSYLKTLKREICVFCDITPKSEQYVGGTKNFKVVKNIYPYSFWDGQIVVDHLLITPMLHTDSLTELTDKQKVEYVNLIESYESKGYNIYARAPASLIKSVIHQHTHLIKTQGRPKRFVLLLRKPYIRLLR